MRQPRGKKPAEPTPGPWAVGRAGYDPNVFVIGMDCLGELAEGLHPIAHLTYPNPVRWHGLSLGETEANAYLMAAAPELLEALQIVLFQTEADRPPSERLALIREVVQKAVAVADKRSRPEPA